MCLCAFLKGRERVADQAAVYGTPLSLSFTPFITGSVRKESTLSLTASFASSRQRLFKAALFLTGRPLLARKRVVSSPSSCNQNIFYFQTPDVLWYMNEMMYNGLK